MPRVSDVDWLFSDSASKPDWLSIAAPPAQRCCASPRGKVCLPLYSRLNTMLFHRLCESAWETARQSWPHLKQLSLAAFQVRSTFKRIRT